MKNIECIKKKSRNENNTSQRFARNYSSIIIVTKRRQLLYQGQLMAWAREINIC